MPNYIVHAHSPSVFPGLTRSSGNTLEANPGDVVSLHPDVPEKVIEAYIANGALEATAEPVTPWPPAVETPDDPEATEAVVRLTKKALADQKAAEEAAAAQAALEAERLAAEQAAQNQ